MVDLPAARRAGSDKDVASKRFVLGRFYSLRTLAVSVRLAPLAWRANGYWGAALMVLREALAAGLPAAPARVKRLGAEEEEVKQGMCAVNSFHRRAAPRNGEPIPGAGGGSQALILEHAATKARTHRLQGRGR